jgi:hypothetical protein
VNAASASGIPTDVQYTLPGEYADFTVWEGKLPSASLALVKEGRIAQVAMASLEVGIRLATHVPFDECSPGTPAGSTNPVYPPALDGLFGVRAVGAVGQVPFNPDTTDTGLRGDVVWPKLKTLCSSCFGESMNFALGPGCLECPSGASPSYEDAYPVCWREFDGSSSRAFVSSWFPANSKSWGASLWISFDDVSETAYKAVLHLVSSAGPSEFTLSISPGLQRVDAVSGGCAIDSVALPAGALSTDDRLHFVVVTAESGGASVLYTVYIDSDAPTVTFSSPCAPATLVMVMALLFWVPSLLRRQATCLLGL